MRWVWMVVLGGVVLGMGADRACASQPQEAVPQASAEPANAPASPAPAVVVLPSRVQYATVPTHMLVAAQPVAVTRIVYSPRLAREIRHRRALERELEYLERRTERTIDRLERLPSAAPAVYLLK